MLRYVKQFGSSQGHFKLSLFFYFLFCLYFLTVNVALVHVHHFKTGPFSSLFTKNMNTFSEPFIERYLCPSSSNFAVVKCKLANYYQSVH